MKQQKNDSVSPEKVEVRKYDIFQLFKKNDKVQICLGNNLISCKDFDTFESAIRYIKSKPYELITNAACFVYDFSRQQKGELK